jgi:hypothetical protein
VSHPTACEQGADRGRLQGRTFAGGPKTRAEFARLMNLDPAAGPGATRVAAVGWIVDHLEVEVDGAEDHVVTFYLDRYQVDKPSLYRSDHLILYYRGPAMWPDLEVQLGAVGLSRFESRTIEDLAALVAADTDVDPVRDRLPRGNPEDQAAYDRQSLLSTWASEDMWYQFFAVAETARGRLDSLDIFERCSFIQHCDRDCLQVTPHTAVPMVDKVYYPWLDRLRKVGRVPGRKPAVDAAAAPPAPPDPERHQMVTTDLGEREVVMGGLDKLTTVLDHVMERGVDNMLFLSCTCVPFVTGEDVESVVKRYRGRTKRPFFYLTTTPQSSLGVFREVLVRQRQAAEVALAGQADPRAVNLVGFTRDPSLDELAGLLGDLGLKVNAVFIPQMNFSVIPQLPRAPLAVLYPNALWQNLYDQLLFDSTLRSIEPPAPYGLGGTRRWLEAVAAAAGVEDHAAAAVERCLAPNRERWEALRREAAGYRLGFVVGSEEVHRLCDPAATWGVPLLAMCEELGFGVDVLIRVTDRSTARQAATQVNALFAEPARHRIRAFLDRERLEKLLAEGQFAAVFSEYVDDHRLGAAGKAQFNLQEFEKGVEGALRTAERLLEVCRLPLFRRYRRFMPGRARAAPAPRAKAARPPAKKRGRAREARS